MKIQLHSTFWIILTAIIALTWTTACEDGVSVQDTPPHSVTPALPTPANFKNCFLSM